MSRATTRTSWTFDQFIEWEAQQPTKHELVAGQVRAMVGSTGDHDLICNNLRRELGNLLHGSSCRLQGPDLKVHAGSNVRYPDALIDCGPRAGRSLFAQRPVAIFEVLSKSTAWIDQTLKLRDYEAIDSLRSYVLISQDEPRVLVYQRDEAGQLGAKAALLLEGLAGSITLPEPALSLSLALLYEGLDIEQLAAP